MGLTTSVQRTGFYGVLDQLGQFLNMEEQKALREQQKNKNKYAVQAIVGMFDKLGPNPSMEQINNATKNSIATAYQYDAPEATQVINPILGMAKEEYQNKIQTSEMQSIRNVVSGGEIKDNQFQTLQGLTSALQLEHQGEKNINITDTTGTYAVTYDRNNKEKGRILIESQATKDALSAKELEKQAILLTMQGDKQIEVAKATVGLTGSFSYAGPDASGNAQILNAHTGNITTSDKQILPKNFDNTMQAYRELRNQIMQNKIDSTPYRDMNASAGLALTSLEANYSEIKTEHDNLIGMYGKKLTNTQVMMAIESKYPQVIAEFTAKNSTFNTNYQNYLTNATKEMAKLGGNKSTLPKMGSSGKVN